MGTTENSNQQADGTARDRDSVIAIQIEMDRKQTGGLIDRKSSKAKQRAAEQDTTRTHSDTRQARTKERQTQGVPAHMHDTREST